MSVCHPDRKHCSKGLCKRCYEKNMADTTPGYRDEKNAYLREWRVKNPEKQKRIYEKRRTLVAPFVGN